MSGGQDDGYGQASWANDPVPSQQQQQQYPPSQEMYGNFQQQPQQQQQQYPPLQQPGAVFPYGDATQQQQQQQQQPFAYGFPMQQQPPPPQQQQQWQPPPAPEGVNLSRQPSYAGGLPEDQLDFPVPTGNYPDQRIHAFDGDKTIVYTSDERNYSAVPPQVEPGFAGLSTGEKVATVLSFISFLLFYGGIVMIVFIGMSTMAALFFGLFLAIVDVPFIVNTCRMEKKDPNDTLLKHVVDWHQRKLDIGFKGEVGHYEMRGSGKHRHRVYVQTTVEGPHRFPSTWYQTFVQWRGFDPKARIIRVKSNLVAMFADQYTAEFSTNVTNNLVQTLAPQDVETHINFGQEVTAAAAAAQGQTQTGGDGLFVPDKPCFVSGWFVLVLFCFRLVWIYNVFYGSAITNVNLQVITVFSAQPPNQPAPFGVPIN